MKPDEEEALAVRVTHIWAHSILEPIIDTMLRRRFIVNGPNSRAVIRGHAMPGPFINWLIEDAALWRVTMN